MSIFQKCQVNVATGVFEKHVVSIMLQIPIFVEKLGCTLFNIYYGQNDLTTIGYPIISFRII